MLYVFGKILMASFLKNSKTLLALKRGSAEPLRMGVVIMAVMRPPELVPAMISKYSHR